MRKQVKILAVALGAALVIVVGIFSFQFIRTGSDADLGPGIVVTPVLTSPADSGPEPKTPSSGQASAPAAPTPIPGSGQ
ncbi:MAG: hypothetical protein SOS98_05315 [Varibaculum sp.]|nr:hypothetical protein [Varibaculum sp.]